MLFWWVSAMRTWVYPGVICLLPKEIISNIKYYENTCFLHDGYLAQSKCLGIYVACRLQVYLASLTMRPMGQKKNVCVYIIPGRQGWDNRVSTVYTPPQVEDMADVRTLSGGDFSSVVALILGCTLEKHFLAIFSLVTSEAADWNIPFLVAIKFSHFLPKESWQPRYDFSVVNN